jgi:hypothetical protein
MGRSKTDCGFEEWGRIIHRALQNAIWPNECGPAMTGRAATVQQVTQND